MNILDVSKDGVFSIVSRPETKSWARKEIRLVKEMIKSFIYYFSNILEKADNIEIGQ